MAKPAKPAASVMLTRAQIKFVSSLQLKKFRRQHSLFTAEGSKVVIELLASSIKLHSLYALPAWKEQNSQLTQRFQGNFFEVNQKELERMSGFKTASQVLGVFEVPSDEHKEPPTLDGPWLALDGIQDPGNLGTILRTADWFGIHYIICSENTAEAFSPKVVQSTMGSIARVKITYQDLEKFLKLIYPARPVYAAMMKGIPLQKVGFENNAILVLGSEGRGISSRLMPFITHPVTIPAHASDGPGILRPESLNASVAAAILCWELQRNKS